jgi:glycosyltransferase involved in cell wall biosynthesis
MVKSDVAAPIANANLVSIVLPNRNQGHYLSRALDALRGQTWNNLEIIVVDDQSTDDSLEVLAHYTALDPRIRFIALEQHGGIAVAVNAGLKKACGEFLYFAASDDFVETSFIERCVTEILHHPEAGLCFSDPVEFDEKSSRITRFPLYLSKEPTYFDALTLIGIFKRNYFHISTNTGLYRAAAFHAAGGYRADLQWLMDWFPTMVIALRHGVCYLPEGLTYLTVRGDSYSATNLRDGKIQRQLIARILALLAAPEYADVAPRMQQALLLPEYQPRTLYWLLQSKTGRGFVAPRLIIRILGRYAWSFIRPFAPIGWRRSLRRLQSGRTVPPTDAHR